jgi:hypothetical protein
MVEDESQHGITTQSNSSVIFTTARILDLTQISLVTAFKSKSIFRFRTRAMFLFYSHIYTKLSEQKLRNFVTRITAQH